MLLENTWELRINRNGNVYGNFRKWFQEGGKLIKGISLIRRKIFLGNNNRNRDVYRNLRTIRNINIVQVDISSIKRNTYMDESNGQKD